ncbi:hypothetical protein RFI_29531, partial [Reticulomyxa filosa]
LTAYVMMDKNKMLIKMKELTFEELFRQTHNCLEWKDLQKIKNENAKFKLFNMKNNMIESDEAVRKEFENAEPSFQLLWTPEIIGKTKTIKNALVVMIGISEYIDNKTWSNLPNVKKKDVKNFRQLFEQELNYEFVCNKKFKMEKEDVEEYLTNVKDSHKLHKNKKKYDALIMIISGHGDEGDVLVTSEGDKISVDEIQASFGCRQMKAFKDYPKILIIDVCRGNVNPQEPCSRIKGKNENQQNNSHNGYGFLVIWSTTKGYQVNDSAFFSESMRSTIVSNYKSGCFLHQMLQEIKRDVTKKTGGAYYCVESQDTTAYDIIFQQRKSTFCIGNM